MLNREVDLEPRRGTGIEMSLCLTVVGELLFGAAKSRKYDANRQRIERLLEFCPVISQDLETAKRYGELKAQLQRLGRPIPENDIWIAACAVQHDLILATRDHHFDLIQGLRVEDW